MADLDGSTAHLGYLIRRANLDFQDFIRTSATVNIRRPNIGLTVIDAKG